MNIYIYGTLILFIVVLNDLNGQQIPNQTDLNSVYSVINPLYNGEIEKAKLNHNKFFKGEEDIESLFLEAQILRWEYLPIYNQNDSITVKYLTILSKITEAESDENEYESFIHLSANLLLAEYNYNNNLLFNASNYGRKAYNLLKNKLEENNINNEWLLPIGLYNYFYEYYLNKNFAFQSLLYFFKNGDKQEGLNQLHKASRNESLVQGEALIYLAHIYLRLEDDSDKAFNYAQKLILKYPDNLKLYEFYIEASLALNKIDNTCLKLIEKLKHSDQIYYQKYGTTYSILANISTNKMTEEEKQFQFQSAEKFILKHNGGNHLLSLLYKQMAEITNQKEQYRTKLDEVKKYDYKLTKL